MRKGLLVLGLFSVVAGCEKAPLAAPELEPAFAVGKGHPLNAVVTFGRDNVGSSFPPPSGHDRSFHAKDKIVPHAIVIARGGTVTFQMGTFHQVVIYDQGVEPEDISLDPADLDDVVVPFPPFLLPDFQITDPDGRLAESPISATPMSWTSPAGTFDQPGTYLVICAIVPHFVEAKMYAWVVVK
jgi:plastocyanin